MDGLSRSASIYRLAPCLSFAGLGEKKVVFQKDGKASHVFEKLVEEFPPLAEGGGFEILRTTENSARKLNWLNAKWLFTHISHFTVLNFFHNLSRDFVVKLNDTPLTVFLVNRRWKPWIK